MGQTKTQKAAMQRYRQTEKGKATLRRYRQSKRGKTIERQYFLTIIGHLRRVFNGIKVRCNNLKCVAYKNYGGRGIKCLFESSDEFVDYVVNVLRVDPRDLQIDRIDNDGDYVKGNIRFVTCSENCKNRRKKVK